MKIKILNIEDKVAKNGSDFLKLECEDKIWRNCFEQQIFGLLKAANNDGVEIDVAIEKSGKYENVVGIVGVNMPEKPGRSRIERAVAHKEEAIGKMVDRKDSSIRVSACKRDAAMFAACPKPREELLAEYKHWVAYFKIIYGLDEKDEV